MQLMLSDEQRMVLREKGITAARMALGFLFLFTGLGMVFSSGGLGYVTSVVSGLGFPMAIASFIALLVVLVKVIAGGALMAGYRTGLAAAILIAFTLLATILVHLDINDVNLFKNLAIIGGLLYAMSYGPGEGWSMQSKARMTPTAEESHTEEPTQSL